MKRTCGAEIFNRYANGGAGGMVDCRKTPAPGEDFCKFHKPAETPAETPAEGVTRWGTD